MRLLHWEQRDPTTFGRSVYRLHREEPTTLLRVARTLPSSEAVTTADTERDRKLLRQFQVSVREVVPGLQLQPSLYTEKSIEAELRRQTNSGLGRRKELQSSEWVTHSQPRRASDIGKDRGRAQLGNEYDRC